MRSLSSVLGALALVALPLGVRAQASQEGSTPEPNLEKPTAPSERTGENGRLSPRLRERTRRNWDPATYDVPLSRPATAQPAPRKRGLDARQRAGIGLGVSLVAFGAGIGMTTAAWAQRTAASFVCLIDCPPLAGWVAPVGWSGLVLLGGGLVGTIVSAPLLAKRRRERKPAHPKRSAPQPYDPLGAFEMQP